MKLTITINMDGASFHPECDQEVFMILEKLAGHCAGYGLSDIVDRPIYDTNGNNVGTVILDDKQ